MNPLSLDEKLQLSRDDMRQMGYQVIDTLVDYFDTQSTARVTNLMDEEVVAAIANEPLPQDGLPWSEVLEQFDRQVISTLSHVDHPRNFSFIPLAGNFVGVMADTLASGYNIFNAVYKMGESATEVERVTVDWLRQIFGMPKEAGGIFVSGGVDGESDGIGGGQAGPFGRRYARRKRLLFRSDALCRLTRDANTGIRASSTYRDS